MNITNKPNDTFLCDLVFQFQYGCFFQAQGSCANIVDFLYTGSEQYVLNI